MGGGLRLWRCIQRGKERCRAISRRKPVGLENGDAPIVQTGGACHCHIQRGQRLVGGKWIQPLPDDARAVALGQPCGHAEPIPRPPGNAQRRQPGGAALRSEGVQKGIGRGVGALARRAKERCRR